MTEISELQDKIERHEMALESCKGVVVYLQKGFAGQTKNDMQYFIDMINKALKQDIRK